MLGYMSHKVGDCKAFHGTWLAPATPHSSKNLKAGGL